MEAAIREAVASGRPFRFDHRVVGAQGQIKWIRSRGQVLRDDTGTPVQLQGSAQEITAEKESETQLKARADQQAAVAHLGQRALGGLDLTTLLQEAVRVVADVLGAERCEVLELTPAGDSLSTRAATPDPLGGVTRSGAAVAIPGKGTPFGLLCVGAAAADAFGATEADFLASVANVLAAAIERHRIDDELAYQALHDPLTGLPNRVLLMDRLAQAAARAGRHPSRLAVLFLDLDRFKVVNDGLGHWAGDELLQAVAARLVAVVRPGDTVARFGGDEFVVLCQDLPDAAHVGVLAERIAAILAEPVTVSGREVTISASIGVVLADAGSNTPEALIRDADTAMYQAKERGRARYEIFDDPARQRVMARLDTEVALRRALEKQEMRVFYQPVVSLSGGRLVGLEALLRWDDPERGLQLPDQFLALAEETGLILPIGTWVLEQACRDAQALRSAHPDFADMVIWVNLSARQLVQDDLPGLIARVLAETGTSPRTLGLEITESVLTEDMEFLGERLRTLKGLGVLLAIDDFGTGFSSLSHLRGFPVDVLKVDRSFVDGITRDAEDHAIVDAVVGLARSLGMHVVAEGVESADQADALRRLGCNAAQGFHWSPARSFETIRASLPDWPSTREVAAVSGT
jgi:diguanylate cyclase (GGDEF)-like protein